MAPLKPNSIRRFIKSEPMVCGLVEAPITATDEGRMMWSRLCDILVSSPKKYDWPAKYVLCYFFARFSSMASTLINPV